MIIIDTCQLCERENLSLTKHHLIPREYGGHDFDTVWICEYCHKQIHGLYTNLELSIRLNSLEELKNDEQISKFIKFIKKQASSKKVKIKKSRNVRR